MASTEQEKKNLITRYLTGEADHAEIEELQKWLGASHDNLLYFQRLKNIWDNSQRSKVAGMTDTEAAFKKISGKISFRTRTNFWYYWKRIAAILFIPLVAANILYFSYSHYDFSNQKEPVYNELFAAFGTRSALKLSDGTLVWLNSGSSIKYPDTFTGDERTVFLKGEAYFEVESNAQKTFIVETSSLSVKATGTKFNVSGYTSAEETEVTLISGKVEVSLPANNKTVHDFQLEVNQHFLFNKIKGTTSISEEDTYKYIAWKDGKLIFRNEPLSQVVAKISRLFNVDIEIKGEEIQNYSFTATFQDESLEEILKLLKISSPIDFIEMKRNPLPDGSFPGKKVIIFPESQKK